MVEFDVIPLIVFVVLVFFVGYLLIRSAKPEQPPAPVITRRAWLQAVIAGIVLTSFLGLILVQCALFSVNTLIVILLIIAVSIYLIFRPKLRLGSDTPLTIQSGIFLISILAAFLLVCLYFGPSEHIFGGWDSGEYVNMGALIADKGRIVYRDDFFASIPKNARAIFTEGGRRYMGFNLMSLQDAIVSPKFMHIYPLWLAIAIKFSGLRLALSLNILFASISIALCYQIALRLHSKRAALAAAVFLAANVIEIWFARSQCAEPLTQLFFLAGIYFWVLWQQDDNRIAAPLSAACLGMMFLTKLDSILLLPIIVIAILLTKKRKGERPFLIVLFILIFYCLIYSYWWDRIYASSLFRDVISMIKGQPIFAAGAVLTYVISLLCALRLKARGRSIETLTPVLRKILGAVLFIGIILFYFVRPYFGSSPERANLLEFSLLFGLGLFWWAVAAFVWAWLKGLRDGELLLWISALGITAFFSISLTGEHHLYPWSARRFLPVVVPALAVFFGCFAAEVYRLIPKILKPLLVAGLAALIILPMIQYSFLITGRDYPGAVEFMEKLGDATEGYDVVICEQVKLAVPLDFLLHRNVLLFKDSEQTIEKCDRVESLITSWLDHGKRVAYVTSGPPIHGKTVTFRTSEVVIFETSVVPLKRHAMPTGITPVVSPVKILEAARPASDVQDGEITVDIGYNCFSLESGFHRLKRLGRGRGAGRWTAPHASLVIPWLSDAPPMELTLNLTTGPRGGAEVPVEIFIENGKVGTVKANGKLNKYSVHTASGVGEGKNRVRLEIRAPSWDPAEAGYRGYPKSVGVFLKSIKIKRSKQ